jgi:hypothetical protein
MSYSIPSQELGCNDVDTMLLPKTTFGHNIFPSWFIVSSFGKKNDLLCHQYDEEKYFW